MIDYSADAAFRAASVFSYRTNLAFGQKQNSTFLPLKSYHQNSKSRLRSHKIRFQPHCIIASNKTPQIGNPFEGPICGIFVIREPLKTRLKISYFPPIFLQSLPLCERLFDYFSYFRIAQSKQMSIIHPEFWLRRPLPLGMGRKLHLACRGQRCVCVCVCVCREWEGHT